MSRPVPCLWFDTRAQEAAEFYVSVFPHSSITEVTRAPAGGPAPEGEVLTVRFVLDGQEFVALDGGPAVPFTEAVSFQYGCTTQAELDRYWAALTDGGEPGRCGWLRDRFGVSWQLVPAELGRLLADPDPERVRRTVAAMAAMTRLDLPALRRAADGDPVP